jgi:hypothetical protein
VSRAALTFATHRDGERVAVPQPHTRRQILHSAARNWINNTAKSMITLTRLQNCTKLTAISHSGEAGNKRHAKLIYVKDGGHRLALSCAAPLALAKLR